MTPADLPTADEPERSCEGGPPLAFVRAIALHREGRVDEARSFYTAVPDDGPTPARR